MVALFMPCCATSNEPSRVSTTTSRARPGPLQGRMPSGRRRFRWKTTATPFSRSLSVVVLIAGSIRRHPAARKTKDHAGSAEADAIAADQPGGAPTPGPDGRRCPALRRRRARRWLVPASPNGRRSRRLPPHCDRHAPLRGSLRCAAPASTTEVALRISARRLIRRVQHRSVLAVRQRATFYAEFGWSLQRTKISSCRERTRSGPRPPLGR